MSTEILKEILAYIDEHIYEKISLLELAEMAGYSPFYFSKLFSEIMGMPITGYIRIRKLQYALGSLLEGRKVLDVSLMYAFDSHEGFTRSFTQLFGSTPSKVKKYLTSYKVPEYCVPNIEGRRMRMGADKESLIDNISFQTRLISYWVNGQVLTEQLLVLSQKPELPSIQQQQTFCRKKRYITSTRLFLIN